MKTLMKMKAMCFRVYYNASFSFKEFWKTFGLAIQLQLLFLGFCAIAVVYGLIIE